MGQTIQRPITNIIFRYLTCDAVQSCWIDQMVLIFSGINANIVTGGTSPINLNCQCPKITNML